MPRESWSHYYRGKRSDGSKEKSSPKTESDTQSGFSETPRTEETKEKPSAQPTPSGERAGAYKEMPKFEDLINDPRIVDANNATKKNWVLQELRQAKYDIQGSDFDRIKAITDKGGSTPWRTNANWNKAKTPYKTAWGNLREWAREQGVWDDIRDESEFRKETGAGKEWGLRDTARSTGISIAMGGLYGLGYAMLAPWKAFELGLKYASSLTGDEQFTKDMSEKIFSKRKEAPYKKEKKDQGPDRAKEEKTRKEIKEMTKNYVLGLKGQITNETRLKVLRKREDYEAAGEERRIELEREVSTNAYHEVWRDMRIDWGKEEIWNQEDEDLFIREMGYDRALYNPSYTQDFLTEREWEDLRRDRENLNKKKALLDRATKDEARENLQKEMIDLDKRIDRLENRAESRFSAHAWPPYYKEKGRSRTRRRQEPDADTEDEE